MSRFHLRRWPALALAGLATAALAQSAPTAVSASADSPSAAAPAGWRSAFDGYRAFADASVAPWREANDTVGRVGGWRAYAREAARPATPSPAASPGVSPVPEPAPAAAGHQH